jgi:ABC-type glutathione transport system ATPase component
VWKTYSLPARPFSPPRSVTAVAGVDLALRRGRRIALVGESGSGKSTLSRLLLDLERPTRGQITFDGKSVRNLRGEGYRRFRRSLHAVFQNPYTSLDPLMRIVDSVAEPLLANGWSANRALERAVALLGRVGLPSDSAWRYPRQFSGGQRQRIAIARALAMDPPLLILDEPVSSLDTAARDDVLRLLDEETRVSRIGFLLITHDLSIIEGLVDEVLVMHLGVVKERGSPEQILKRPSDPYTRTLLQSVPPGYRSPGWPVYQETGV